MSGTTTMSFDLSSGLFKIFCSVFYSFLETSDAKTGYNLITQMWGPLGNLLVSKCTFYRVTVLKN